MSHCGQCGEPVEDGADLCERHAMTFDKLVAAGKAAQRGLSADRPPLGEQELGEIERKLGVWVSTPGSEPPLTFEDITRLVATVRGLREALENIADTAAERAIAEIARQALKGGSE